MKKIETLAEYQQLASRTCPDLGTLDLNLLHMNLGITTEIGEVLDIIKRKIAYGKSMDLINLGEEIADTSWYISNKALLSLHENVKFAWANNNILISSLSNYDANFPPIQNDEEVVEIMMSILQSVVLPTGNLDIDSLGIASIALMMQVCKFYNIDYWQALTNNIAKLQVRYPDKFSNEAALNRNLEAERKELEKETSMTIVREDLVNNNSNSEN